VAAAAAVTIVANVVLLDVAEHRDDRVGKLSRRILLVTGDGQPQPETPVTAGSEATAPASTEPPSSTDTADSVGRETDDDHERGDSDDD
jgi:hypothetical protein